MRNGRARGGSIMLPVWHARGSLSCHLRCLPCRRTPARTSRFRLAPDSVTGASTTGHAPQRPATPSPHRPTPAVIVVPSLPAALAACSGRAARRKACSLRRMTRRGDRRPTPRRPPAPQARLAINAGAILRRTVPQAGRPRLPGAAARSCAFAVWSRLVAAASDLSSSAPRDDAPVGAHLLGKPPKLGLPVPGHLVGPLLDLVVHADDLFQIGEVPGALVARCGDLHQPGGLVAREGHRYVHGPSLPRYLGTSTAVQPILAQPAAAVIARNAPPLPRATPRSAAADPHRILPPISESERLGLGRPWDRGMCIAVARMDADVCSGTYYWIGAQVSARSPASGASGTPRSSPR